ncbi:MAG: hypothetical protein ABEJ76_06765 [Halanaeroarchaeum sp.]
MASPGGDFPPVHLGRDPDSAARTVAVPEIQRVGTGAVTIEWFPRSVAAEWPIDLAVDTDAALTSGLVGGTVMGDTTDLTVAPPATQS